MSGECRAMATIGLNLDVPATVGQRLARTHGSGGCLNDLTQAEVVVMR
jgi:hypothetical protein